MAEGFTHEQVLEALDGPVFVAAFGVDPDGDSCGERSPLPGWMLEGGASYFCTRPPGHRGPHVAQGVPDLCGVAAWA